MWSHQGTFMPQPHRDRAAWWTDNINKGAHLIMIHHKTIYFFYVFFDSLYSLFSSPRGLITCGRCPCCLSRTSPITSVSPCLWVNPPWITRGAFTRPVRVRWLTFVSTCFSFAEWRELRHGRGDLIVLRLPFFHSKQLYMRKTTMCSSAFKIRHLLPLHVPFLLLCEGIIVHYFLKPSV